MADCLVLCRHCARLLQQLQEENDAIEQILAANYPDARRFGLAILSEKKHLDEPHRKMMGIMAYRDQSKRSIVMEWTPTS